MKLLFALLLSSIILFAAEIDVKLFENSNQQQYYEDIKKEIETASTKALRSKEIIQAEILNLAKLQEAQQQKIQIEKFDTKVLNKKTINSEEYYSVLLGASMVQSRLDQNNKIISDLQSKLLGLKQSIEKITEEEKPKLLSYQLEFAYYKMQQKNLQRKVELLKTHKEELVDALVLSLDNLDSNEGEFDANLALLNTKIEKYLKEKNVLALEQEKGLIEGGTPVEGLLQ
ncbi:MAG: mechanosensitive ion channel protein MscS, partial [Sulfurimonas sp.]|nr:mechanosensitive ion channel protein MscS [Sulfurimonas sp.]